MLSVYKAGRPLRLCALSLLVVIQSRTKTFREDIQPFYSEEARHAENLNIFKHKHL